MAININSYQNYLNSMSINTQNQISKGRSNAIPGISDSDNADGSPFELALMSMLNQAAPAYDTITELNKTGEFTASASAGKGDALALYEQLSGILNTYGNLNSDSIYPRSIEESLFKMLDGGSSDDQGSGFNTDSLLRNIIGNDTSAK